MGNTLDSLAQLIVSASAGSGFYVECYGHLVHALSMRCKDASESRAKAMFLSSVRAALSEQFRTIVQAMSADSSYECGKERLPQLLPSKLRDRLVNICKLAATLYHSDIYSVRDVEDILQNLGVLNAVSLRFATASLPDTTSSLELPGKTLPTASMM